MSRCSIIEFRDGLPAGAVEYGNSWGGAARIWTALYDKYLRDPQVQYDNWLTDSTKPGSRRLWDLVVDSRPHEFEKAVHYATFDRFIVERKNFTRFAKHLREFAAAYPCTGVDHLPAWADFIEKSTADAVGFHHTSVSENLWFAWDEEKDESIPYDLRTGDTHSEVYEAIDCNS
jgi:hypothetical protein